MYIYILCLILIFVLYIILFKFKRGKNSKKIFCIGVFFIFTLIQGFRCELVGTDTSKYIKYYLMSEKISWWQVLSRDVLNFEIGFRIINENACYSSLSSSSVSNNNSCYDKWAEYYILYINILKIL